MGQLFYSMSLAMGIMITYGSYMKKNNSIEGCVRQIELFDTGIAFLAGLMIIPATYAFSGGAPEALGKGPSLMFATLPKVFETMAGGQIIIVSLPTVINDHRFHTKGFGQATFLYDIFHIQHLMVAIP